MINKIINKIEDRLELAEKRNFETIYLTLKPEEMVELLKALKKTPEHITKLIEDTIQDYLVSEEMDAKVKGQIINELKNIKHEVAKDGN